MSALSFFDLAERFRARFQIQRDQANHFYKLEEARFGADYAMERERYRASSARDIEGLRHTYRIDERRLDAQNAMERETYRGNLSRDLEGIRHTHRITEQDQGAQHAMQREQYRGGLSQKIETMRHGFRLTEQQHAARDSFSLETSRQKHKTALARQDETLKRWTEEFRGRLAKEVEELRQDGALALQEREHVHQRIIFELELAEQRLDADIEHARALEQTRQGQAFELFRDSRLAVYELEAAQFVSILSEREDFTRQLLAEYATRNATGQQVIDATAAMLLSGIQDNAKMNEMILAAAIGKLSGEAAHAQSLATIKARAEHGLSDDIGRFIKDKGI